MKSFKVKAKKTRLFNLGDTTSFLDEGVFEAIGRDDVGFPTYIYLVNRLYQKGIHANVSFIETESGHFQGETFEDLLNSVEFSLGNLTEKENKIWLNSINKNK